jgi:hypothetical protein
MSPNNSTEHLLEVMFSNMFLYSKIIYGILIFLVENVIVGMDPSVQQSGVSMMTTISDSSQLLCGKSLLSMDNESKGM